MPGDLGWKRTARTGERKYFIVSSDSHHSEGDDFLADIEPLYRNRIPTVRIDDDGSVWLLCEGNKPYLVKHGGLAGSTRCTGRALHRIPRT